MDKKQQNIIFYTFRIDKKFHNLKRFTKWYLPANSYFRLVFMRYIFYEAHKIVVMPRNQLSNYFEMIKSLLFIHVFIPWLCCFCVQKIQHSSQFPCRKNKHYFPISKKKNRVFTRKRLQFSQWTMKVKTYNAIERDKIHFTLFRIITNLEPVLLNKTYIAAFEMNSIWSYPYNNNE